MKKRHIALLIILLILAALIAGAGYLYIRESKQYEDHFFHGTTVNGVNVEGMTVDEVEAMLEKSADTDYRLTITFPGGQTEVITGEDIGYAYHSDGFAEKLKQAQKPLEWIRGYLHDTVITIPVPVDYDEEMLARAIDALPELQDPETVAPVDAHMTFEDSAFVVVPDVTGKTLDTIRIREAIDSAVYNQRTDLHLEDQDPYIYTAAAVTADDAELNEQAAALNSYIGADILYDLPGSETWELDGATLIDWLVPDEETLYRRDEEVWNQHIRDYVAAMAEKVDTLGTVKTFPATGIGDIQVTLMTYGYQMDQEAEIEWLTEALQTDQITERTPTYLSWETSDPDDNNGFGGTYVEIDCTRQHLWAYENGVVAYETDIISGAMDSDRATPSGVYMFVTKESPSVLVGRDAAGKVIYRTPVSYFMPFNSMAIGIHDATWQPAFGGSLNTQGYGSHGCINVSLDAAATLYDMINFDEPVIVYY